MDMQIQNILNNAMKHTQIIPQIQAATCIREACSSRGITGTSERPDLPKEVYIQIQVLALI